MRQLTKFQTSNLPARTLSYKYGNLNIFAVKGNHVFATEAFDYIHGDVTVSTIKADMSDLFTSVNYETEFSVAPGQYGIGNMVYVYGEVTVPKAVTTALKQAKADLRVAEKQVKQAKADLAKAEQNKLAVLSNLEKFLAAQAKS